MYAGVLLESAKVEFKPEKVSKFLNAYFAVSLHLQYSD